MTPNRWTFLSNHTHVLVCIARDPDVRVREMAIRVGITERAVLRILGELEDAGFIRHERVGRRNHYRIELEAPLRHPLEHGVSLRDLLKSLVEPRLLRAVGSGSAGARLER